MLTSGMVPALYPDDEKEQIIGNVRTILLSSSLNIEIILPNWF